MTSSQFCFQSVATGPIATHLTTCISYSQTKPTGDNNRVTMATIIAIPCMEKNEARVLQINCIMITMKSTIPRLYGLFQIGKQQILVECLLVVSSGVPREEVWAGWHCFESSIG